ncbi:MAG: hypothetical protein E6G34_11905 [Actinobacteria bacterium]|nr:MAG: hypothetical protein E6G34_11905 [Actinomycetota bacterium]
MDALDRRSFLKIAGVGSAAAAFPLASRLGEQTGGFSFRATGGLPEAPLPSYATQIVEGHVDVAKGSGLVTSRVLAGHPDETSLVGIPGLGRMIRVTAVDSEDRRLRLRGVMEDRSQLRRGESPAVEIVVDRRRGVVHAPFLGRQRELRLAKP